MHKYIIMGPQGSGKGTQAKLLKKKLNLSHFSVGDIFRWHVQSHTKLAARIKRLIDAGQLVPDEIVEEIIRRRLSEHDWNYGFILDGFPRNVEQAQFFLESYDVDAVIYIDVPKRVTIERALARRICSNCKLDYNLIFHRPEVEDTCDVCGGRLVARADDNEEALNKRLGDFTSKTLPTLELFDKKELVLRIDGTQDRDTVFAEICEKLELEQPTSLES
ncbi:adenylate kinase family protein [Algisphaera agarilytica]|uniref:Adenylate kinase n=1 Tax=Algisphaera agarilytica TaxID=1385975 RepID=A0A7X0LKU2_9BACT|nr:nucleoside monophosphate kinase [Algisphaera agarilytica]MBB6429976.1 adenylate kinase [Algisphaera agarilytica]